MSELVKYLLLIMVFNLNGQGVIKNKDCYFLSGKPPKKVTGGYYVKNTLCLYDDSTFTLRYKTFQSKGQLKDGYPEYEALEDGRFTIEKDTIYLTISARILRYKRFLIRNDKVYYIPPQYETTSKRWRPKLYPWKKID